MGFDNAYEAITEDNDDARWAYGTGFADPMATVPNEVPADVDAAALSTYCLMLGDDALIASHRLQEWCSRAPELEDEVALANIGLDLLGQARLLLDRAGVTALLADPTTPFRDEDSLAFFRNQNEFRNVRLVEEANGDFAASMVRLLVFSTWRLALLCRLAGSRDPVLAAIAAKGVKEVTYHRDYAANWVVRLGDGTALSRRRTSDALVAIWPWVDELFVPHPTEDELVAAGVAVDVSELRGEFDSVLARVCEEATLTLPEVPARTGVSGRTGRDGVHTEALGFVLAEMQSLARAHPEATW